MFKVKVKEIDMFKVNVMDCSFSFIKKHQTEFRMFVEIDEFIINRVKWFSIGSNLAIFSRIPIIGYTTVQLR